MTARRQITDDDLIECFPDVVITADNKAFYRGWLDRQLVLGRCRECGNWDAEHHPLCPECWSTSMEPRPVSGRGAVYMLFWLQSGAASDSDDSAGPHPVATVELAEQPGLRYTSTVLDAKPGELAIGDPVELAWTTRHGQPFPVFVRVSSKVREGRAMTFNKLRDEEPLS